jgi:hypothetical protein
MILSTLKAKLYVAAAGVLGVLLMAVRILLARNSKLKSRVENAEAKVNHAREVAKQDIQIDQQTDSHRAELINELEDTGDSTGFRTPDKLWGDDD